MQEVIVKTNQAAKTSKVVPVITTTAYTAGDSVGDIQTISRDACQLHSLTILDKSNQKAAFDILIFDASPGASTTTDNSPFTFGGTDDLKVIARVSVATGDYVTIAGEAVAQKSSLDLSLQSASTNLYAVPVTSGTPTYAVGALQFTWGTV